MTTNGVLARVIANRYSSDLEDVATDTLAYLLNEYPHASQSFLSLARRIQPDLPDIIEWRTQDSGSLDTSIPDLVGVSEGGIRRLIIESKFWAGLTENQPITYLRRLPADEPGALIFIVPDRRRASVFGELVRRCEAEADLALREVDSDAHVAVIDGRTMAVTTWRAVITELRAQLERERDHDGLADLRQLDGLCGYEDAKQILPFSSEELTGSIGQRIIDLVTIIGETVDRLAVSGEVTTAGHYWSSGVEFNGRYFKLRGWECLMQINYWRWANEAPTPLWLQITDRSARDGSLGEALDQLRESIPTRLYESGGKLQIPLWVPPGAERDEIISDLARQVLSVHALLADGPALRP